MREGWEVLLEEAGASGRASAEPLRAYSEFMPGPRVGWKPCGKPDASVRSESDPLRFNVSEFEQRLEITPGLERIARHVGEQLNHLMHGRPCQISKRLLTGNPAWPTDLAARTEPAEEEITVILSLALSRTQDDKGRVRWTLFGTSHDGPARAFWRSFMGVGASVDGGAAFRQLLAWTLQVDENALADLRRSGVRVLPVLADRQFPRWDDGPLPGFLGEATLGDGEALDGVRAVVTFRPFAELPAALQRAYLAGAVRLIPTPASLIFLGETGYRTLAAELRHAMQIPLLHLFERCEHIYALRIPQSGWLHETPVRMPGSQVPEHHVRRSHRWEKHGRHVDDALAPDAAIEVRNDHVTMALFSTAPEVIGLYDKPMARNVQIWTEEFRLLLDGPRAGPPELAVAAAACQAEGRFGYRFYFPPMRVGERELFWHLPLVARLGEDGKVEICPQALSGYLSAEREGADPVELVPRRLERAERRDAIDLFQHEPTHRHATRRNVRKLLEWSELLDGRLAPSFARRLLTVGRKSTLEEWLEELPQVAADHARGEALARQLRACLGPEPPTDPAAAITLSSTHGRAFEESYWRAITELSDGRFALSNNADVVAPEAGGPDPQETPEKRRRRQLEAVRNYLHASYQRLFERHGMGGRAVCADQIFRWETDFDFSWWGGWRRNRDGSANECNVVVVIPGRNRGEAVVMGDHFDTAYMEDLYYPARGGAHRRVAAAGADDNHSATAALLMAADALLPLAREGKLERDVWLVHLTGEEFPADCMGSRALVQALIGSTLGATLADGSGLDLSATRVVAAFILDMVAHNNDREHNVFQISPGDGTAAARLALLAHLANERWNAAVREWNAAPERRGQGCGRRLHPGETIPPLAEHPVMTGQVRPEWDLHSTLYNTDAQIFSDAGVPVVLFMEDYDLNRHGYHDSEDTIANIDLDYGAALVAIAIETVAQAACLTSG
jgi:hypothetical protein